MRSIMRFALLLCGVLIFALAGDYVAAGGADQSSAKLAGSRRVATSRVRGATECSDAGLTQRHYDDRR